METVSASINDRIGTIFFSHPKGNSLPTPLLNSLIETITELGAKDEVRVIVLKTGGDKVFCAGASFDELKAVTNETEAFEFFSGISKVILAMRSCPKFIIGRIQGKVVGGGVGITAACDYTLAHESASIRLSELALGLGPFLIGPAVERKLGKANFSYASIDADWRDSAWCKANGLYTEVYKTHSELDTAVEMISKKLSDYSPNAMRELKKVLWEGTEDWEIKLFERAKISGRLVLTDYCKNAISKAG
jgi:methylglutaconyl-CoA hydratase